MTGRVLIFVVAYNAGKHIRSVLDRLPRQVFNHPDFHILIIDDCSKDETAKVASAHARDQGFQNVTVMRNPLNQGYGGNQKIGYRYAIENGFGLVILLHGDGQYAPELVLEFVKLWNERGAQVILGSRMIDKARARAGGMPLYKWIGNQILTKFQNLVTGSELSEFHTGYRAYDTGFLSKVPFELNTDDFHFDTEILLQAYASNAKFAEFSIPTHYGDEICHVNGMRYAWDVVKASIMYRFQKIGFFCSMQYRGLLGFQDPHARSIYSRALEFIHKPGKVLDLSSAPAAMEKKLAERGCKVTVVPSELEGKRLAEDVSGYDYVLVLDRMERIADGERFLIDCRYGMGSLEHRPTFIFSTGNVAFLGLRVLLGLGLFNYGERGILKVDYKRLFTLSSFRRLLRESGYEPGTVRGVGVPFQLMGNSVLWRVLGGISDGMARLWPSLFAYQFIIEAKPKHHTLMLLSKAQRFYETQARSGTQAP